MHSRAPEFTPGFFGGFRVAHLLRFFCVVLLYVFTIRVPCCDVCYDFRMETMLDSSLPPVVYRRTRVLFASYLYASVIVVSNTYCVVFLFCFSSSCVGPVASFSGLSIFDWPFGILKRFFSLCLTTYFTYQVSLI